ncbi:hypothetical protein Tsp_03073 [Trichinella spiralis]|uniref:hypothetical protein n=1 Tax=Trichinella spiralis TaxID=6334 RepID=UPI0001EFB7F4|nr:hypothetical protein Tsp_03073 [Trichinella spiralis]
MSACLRHCRKARRPSWACIPKMVPYTGPRYRRGSFGTDAEHQAGSKNAMRDVNFPIKSTTGQRAVAAHADRPIAPIRMEKHRPTVGTVNTNRIILFVHIPSPTVVAGIFQRPFRINGVGPLR